MAVRDESVTRRRVRSTNEQFRELGRFVQEFELMVSEIRTLCMFLMGGDHMHVQIALNHHSMTAYALMEITIGIVGQIIKNSKYDATKKRELPELVSQIRAEYQDLAQLRNTLLHGTWYIGWTHEAQRDFSELTILRGKSSLSEGFAFAKTPQSTADLKAITARCKSHQRNINGLHALLSHPETPVGEVYTKGRQKKWLRK